MFEKVEKYRRKGSLITSNTSGIPIELMLEGRSDDFQSNFCGTHFFNPPRYLKLLEIIPSSKTKPEVVDFFLEYGNLFLGKTTVKAKDTPAFIAIELGCLASWPFLNICRNMSFQLRKWTWQRGLFRVDQSQPLLELQTLVGLDTLTKVAGGVHKHCLNDEMNKWFEIPDFLNKMLDMNWLGDKTGQGIFIKNQKIVLVIVLLNN